MAKMLMGQIDHARNRVRDIKNELIGVQPKPVKTYGVDNLADGLRDGTAKFSGAELQGFAQEWADTYVRESSSWKKPSFEKIVLDYAFSEARAVDKARFDAEEKIYDARCALVNAEATKVEDAIVLGDNAAALLALQGFAAFTV